MRTKTFLVALSALILLCMPELSFAQTSIPKKEKGEETIKGKPEPESASHVGNSCILTDGYYLIWETDFEGRIVCDHSGYYPAGTPLQLFFSFGPENTRLIIKRTDTPIPTPMDTIIIPAG